MKKYKWITIFEKGKYNDKPAYDVKEKNGDVLGWIYWDAIGEKYGYEPPSPYLFYAPQLRDIIDFMENEIGKE